MKQAIFTILMSLGISVILSAQTSLEGKVTDKSTGEALIFATVVIYKNGVVVTGTDTDFDGKYAITDLKPGTYDVTADYIGYSTQKISGIIIKADKVNRIDFSLSDDGVRIEAVEVVAYKVPLMEQDNTTQGKTVTAENIRNLSNTQSGSASIRHGKKIQFDKKSNREGYNTIIENNYTCAKDDMHSTFGIDVDKASYSNVRRMIEDEILPPPDAVRIEEMINYFNYDLPKAESKKPFEAYTQLTVCPWNKKHQVLHIGLQAKNVDRRNLLPSNLVFLLDVSGSMSSPNKLPLVKESLKILIDALSPSDRISIVVYAGAAGVVLPSTEIRHKTKIIKALDDLRSSGSTAGGAGIELAYKIAKKNFRKNGNNRVILCTDGDFNVGINSNQGLEDLISKKRESNIFLSVLGFGMGNYQDGLMQTLATKGNGNHFYIDSEKEAKKIFVDEITGTLHTLAKDVKIQMEFNKDVVDSFRLIGYENRMLETEDFDDDKKDAGEMGVGHQVTALYEIIPAKNSKSNEHLAKIKFRYKDVKAKTSKKHELEISNDLKTIEEVNPYVRFSMAVTEFGLLLRSSSFKANAHLDNVLSLARSGFVDDPNGYFQEFIDLVEQTKNIKQEIALK